MSVSSMVRRGAVLADIGTDHAYLPIYLLKSGIISRAVCSDINKGPLASAEENLKEEGLAGAAELLLTSGASELSGKGITDYAICGMGGELIARIIEEAPHLRNSELLLILQPMTKHEQLRSYLAGAGFEVLMEKYSLDEGKYYTAIQAQYTGKPYTLSDYDAYFGKGAEGLITDEARVGYIRARGAALAKIVKGKKLAEADCSLETGLLKELSERMKFTL